VAKLPTVTSPLPRDLQQFVQRVREALDSGGPDAVVTARQLIAAGVVESTTGGGITPIGGTIEAPRAPSGLTASGALASVIISWNGPQYKGHAYTEIWAHTSDVIGDAVLVGMTAGNSFAHNLGATATRYYWVRNVNQNGVVSAFNATNGVSATTGTDPAYLLSVLTGEVTASQLASSLGTRIDLIDGAANVAGSVNARIATEATNTTNALALKADASTVTTLATTVGSNTSAISAETTARTTADTSLASDITTLQTTTGGHTTSIGNNSTAITGLGTRVTSAEGTITSTSTALTSLSTTVSGNTTSINTQATSINGLEAQFTVKIDNNGAVAGFGLASTTTGSGNITSEFIVNADRFAIMRGGSDNTAAVVPFVVQTTQQTINGETVPAGVYMDTAFIKNGTITNAKIGDAAIDSAKIVNATIVAGDIADATITGAKIDSATITNANIATGTITSANIQNGTIQEADIGNAQISNAKIKDVIQSSSYSAGSAGWKIDKSGSAEFNDATFRGTLDVGGSSGSRMTISSTKIEVYDGSTLRVKIGDLS